MSTSQATLELAVKAKDLASGAIDAIGDNLKGLGSTASGAASRISGAFEGMGSQLAAGIGMATETLASGGSIGDAMSMLGIFMAGQLAETFAEQMLERLVESSLLSSLAAPLAAIGTSIGGLISAAIPIGMALLPVLLVAALVGAVAFLIANPEIVGKITAFVGGLVGTIGDLLRQGLGILADIVPKAFAAAWQLVVNGVKAYIGFVVDFWTQLPQRLLGLGVAIVTTIIGGLASLGGRVAQIVGDAFRSLRLDIGPFHITGAGVTVDLPNIDVPHFAGGVRNFGGGMAIVGERGPELVRLPRGSDVLNHQQIGAAGGGGGGTTLRLEGVSEAQLLDIVERGLYVRLRAAGTSY